MTEMLGQGEGGSGAEQQRSASSGRGSARGYQSQGRHLGSQVREGEGKEG